MIMVIAGLLFVQALFIYVVTAYIPKTVITYKTRENFLKLRMKQEKQLSKNGTRNKEHKRTMRSEIITLIPLVIIAYTIFMVIIG